MVCVRFVRRPRAVWFGRYPSSAAASFTLATISDVIRPRVAGLSTRDTVDGCTPTRSATSLIVTLLRIANFVSLNVPYG
jgi:hypothetical protein